MFTLQVVEDTDTINPLEFDDDIHFWGHHPRYFVGRSRGKPYWCDPDADWDTWKRAAEVYHHADLVFFVGMGDSHGARYYRQAEADRHTVGIIYLDSKAGVNLDSVPSVVNAFLAEYSAWADGIGYGYQILDRDGEGVDSCWGFYTEESAREAGESALSFLPSQPSLPWRA